MKILAIFLFIAIATASFHDAFNREKDEVVLDFLVGMEQAPSLKSALDITERDNSIDEIEDHIKTELAKGLKKKLENLLNKIKDVIEHGNFAKEIYGKLKEVGQKTKELRETMGEKAKNLVNEIKHDILEIFGKLHDRITVHKRSNDDEESYEGLTFTQLLRELKKSLLKKVETEHLKEKIIKILGQFKMIAHHFLETLKEKGRAKLEQLIDHLLGDDTDKRSLGEHWEKIKNYFKDLNIDLKEKFFKFGEWVNDVMGKGMTHSKNKLETIVAVGKEFLKHLGGISKEIANEASGFFCEHKDELGDIYEEIKEKINEILKKKNEGE